jgi:hypothetical protein
MLLSCPPAIAGGGANGILHLDAAQTILEVLKYPTCPLLQPSLFLPTHIHIFSWLASFVSPSFLRAILLIASRLASTMSAPLSHADLTLLAQLLIRLSPTGLVTDCTSCGGAVALSICRSDKNGNGGKPMARVCAALIFVPLYRHKLPAYIMFVLPMVSQTTCLPAHHIINPYVNCITKSPQLSTNRLL